MLNRSASELLNVLRDIIPAEVTIALQHLRRFAKPEYLPRHLQRVDVGLDAPDVSKSAEEQLSSTREAKSTTSHVLICPTATVSLDTLEQLFRENIELFGSLTAKIREIIVPVFAPTSALQAAEWSEKYWPTIYKNTNPYGPHPALVRRAELELLAGDDADHYMDLAREVAVQTACGGFGSGIGVVIVERLGNPKSTRVVSVAGDARFTGLLDDVGEKVSEATSSPDSGNVMGHAVLRAISMVAQKRRTLAQLEDDHVATRDKLALSPEHKKDPAPFASSPLCELEKQYSTAANNLSPNGYLCLDLEIYLTHEPCVMCAMAILHSRFSRVVFEKRMQKTGALCADDPSLGHGLFWRDQLNWKFLAWQWQSSAATNERSSRDEDDFHA